MGKLKCTWTVEGIEDLQAFQSIDAEDELTKLLSYIHISQLEGLREFRFLGKDKGRYGSKVLIDGVHYILYNNGNMRRDIETKSHNPILIVEIQKDQIIEISTGKVIFKWKI